MASQGGVLVDLTQTLLDAKINRCNGQRLNNIAELEQILQSHTYLGEEVYLVYGQRRRTEERRSDRDI